MRARLIKKADIESMEAEKQVQPPPVSKVTNVADWVKEREESKRQLSATSVRERFALLFGQPRAANG